MHYRMDKMDGFWRIWSVEGSFCYLIEGKEKAVLIDTANGFGRLDLAVRSVTDKPLIILNTHGHGDHTGGNGMFEDMAYVHEADYELLQQHTCREWREMQLKRPNIQQQFPENFDEAFYLNIGSGNYTAIQDGAMFDAGGVTIRAYHVPGHTPGCMCYHWVEGNVVFNGDSTGPLVFMFDISPEGRARYVEGVERVAALNADQYWGGHEDYPMSAQEVAGFAHIAKTARYEDGAPFNPTMNAGAPVRICTLGGVKWPHPIKPEFASVVIGPKA